MRRFSEKFACDGVIITDDRGTVADKSYGLLDVWCGKSESSIGSHFSDASKVDAYQAVSFLGSDLSKLDLRGRREIP